MASPTPTVAPVQPSAHTRQLTAADLPAIRQLESDVFGPGRFARTAYRIREGTQPLSPFCRGAILDGTVIATLRMTPIAIGTSRPHLLLGPLAVAPGHTNQGHGRRLITEALADAKTQGIGIVTLVGDQPYYGRFGFVPVPPGTILFPGPVNPARILACELTPSTLATATGLITATPL